MICWLTVLPADVLKSRVQIGKPMRSSIIVEILSPLNCILSCFHALVHSYVFRQLKLFSFIIPLAFHTNAKCLHSSVVQGSVNLSEFFRMLLKKKDGGGGRKWKRLKFSFQFMNICVITVSEE